MAQHLYGPSPDLTDGGDRAAPRRSRCDRHHHDRLRQLRHAGHADLRRLRGHVSLRSRADRRGPARSDRTSSTPPPGPGRAGSEAAPCRSLSGHRTSAVRGPPYEPERAGSRPPTKDRDQAGRRQVVAGGAVGRPLGGVRPAGRPRDGAMPRGPPRDSHSPACRVPCCGASGPPGSDHLPWRAGARGAHARARARPRRDRHRLGRAIAASARRLGAAQGRRPARRHGLHVPESGALDHAERAGRRARRPSSSAPVATSPSCRPVLRHGAHTALSPATPGRISTVR